MWTRGRDLGTYVTVRSDTVAQNVISLRDINLSGAANLSTSARR